MIRAGDKIRILPEWQDAGDDEFERFAIEDEDGGRVKVRAIIPGWTINPVEVVQTYMIEVIK